ncbi:hypothetical protein VKS41_007708 [Umbelopsis sp. WA50703]
MAQKPAELDPQELARFAARLSEHMKELEASVDQWREYRDDYQQLGDLLANLPDKTSYDIMVPLGKLAYMPGKLVHTNEVLALLGDNWFAETSAKHAAEIVARRQKVVEDNLQVVETQLNETNARAGVTPGVFKAEQYGMNEQGEPFMEIREELPEHDQDVPKPIVNAPDSVEAARKLASQPKSKAEQLADQALLEKLKALELEEEGELSDEEDELADQDQDEDEELSDEYDTEIAESMFDHFEDDEEYGMDGVVDGEDFSYHETDEQEADEAAENMDTIITPSVQSELDHTATQSPNTSTPTALQSDITDTATPLESVVKERTTAEPPRGPDNQNKKAKKVAPIIKPRVSRFKKSVQEQRSQDDEEKTPRKTVSWGPDIIHEHEDSQHTDIPTEPVYNIRSPADIYHQLLDQRLAEQADQDEWAENAVMDMQSLIKDASTMKETVYMPSERDIPQVTAAPKKKVSRFKQQRNQDAIDTPVSTNTTRPTKLDTSVMRGAVVEKETENVDMDEVEDNMLEKEVAAEYQRKRQNFIASQGGLTFANKPEFQVYDDDLPLPSNTSSSSSANDSPDKPKKISKFKAAKLAAAQANQPS